MTGSEPGKAVATTAGGKALSPQAAEAKALREIVTSIRGTQWGKEGCSPAVQVAVARYCLRNGLDAVRHVEVLGGRIYLTGEFYEEKGAPLVLAGKVIVGEPEFVQHDERLVELSKHEDKQTAEWARDLHRKRIQTRIELGIPDDATGACIYKARIPSAGGESVIVGFNWCGGKSKVKKGKNGDYRADPVGDAEPIKTAQSRSKRRMWRQIVVALPELEAKVGGIEASVKLANSELAEIVSVETTQAEAFPRHPAALGAPATEPELERLPADRIAAVAASDATVDSGEPGAEPPGRSKEDEEFEKDLAGQ